MQYVMLKDICNINMGQSPSSESYNEHKEGMPFFQGNADFGERYPITRKWSSEPTKVAEAGDILISVRAPIGAVNYATERCYIGRGLAALTPNKYKASSEFIFWLLKAKNDELNSKGTGSTFTFITKAQECLSEADFEKCRFVEAGSILMTCIAGSINCIGNVAVNDRCVTFNQQINAIVPEQDEVLYLYWLMQLSKPMTHRTINMALKGIHSKSQLSEIAFPLPPITLQEQFAAFVEQTDKSKLYGKMEVAA